MSATQTQNTAALPSPVGQNAPAVMLRRGRPHQHDLQRPANLTRPSEQLQMHRRKLHTGHGGHGHGGETLPDETGSDKENDRAYEQQDDTGKLNHKKNRREAHRSGLTTVRCSWRSSGWSQGRTRRAGRFRPTQVMQASRREALGRGDHVGLARHDGKGSTVATASGGAERLKALVWFW